MPPQIVVTGRDDQVTARHKNHAEEKIAKLERYFDGLHKIEVVLGHEKDGAEAELVLSIRGGKPVVCHGHGAEPFAAIDAALHKAETALTRHKEKIKGHKGAPTSRHPEEIPMANGEAGSTGDDPEDESYQDIVEGRDFS